jgi:hypothetical protein
MAHIPSDWLCLHTGLYCMMHHLRWRAHSRTADTLLRHLEPLAGALQTDATQIDVYASSQASFNLQLSEEGIYGFEGR